MEGGSNRPGQSCSQTNTVEFKRLQAILMKRPGGDREMVEILALVMFHDEKVVLEAVRQAIEAGAPSKQIILNMLSRLLEG